MILTDKTHLIIENESWWKNKFLEMSCKVEIGNMFYFVPCTQAKWSRRGYFLLNTKWS